jgi:glutaredoxin
MPQVTIPSKPSIRLQDQDNTSVQGFEQPGQNVIFVEPGDCPHCLKPFHGRGAEGSCINVYTSYGKDQWCAKCVQEGIEKGVCVQESKLSKEEKKQWEKYIKKLKKQK